MTEPLRHVIEQARTEGVYRCARCDYRLSEVPLRDDLSIVCPECGYDMVFSVQVRLMPRDPEFDRAVRGRLGRIERLMFWIAIMTIAVVVGLFIVVYGLVG